MRPVCHLIKGIPFPHSKARVDLYAPDKWTDEVIAQTKDLPHAPGNTPLIMKVTFYLPAEKFTPDLPFGPDLESFQKRLLDALGQTVFRDAKAKDACVVSLHASKVKVASADQAGAHIEIFAAGI